MRKFFIAAAAITLMMTVTVLTSCTDDNDNPVPVVVTDDKPFPYGTDIDETVRPSDDFYRYINGLWLNSPNPAPSMMKQVEDQLDQLSDDALATSRDPCWSCCAVRPTRRCPTTAATWLC